MKVSELYGATLDRCIMRAHDRELTERAARAAGKEVLGWIGDHIHTRDHADATADIGQFDPLNSDGDALRLASKLRMIVDFEERTANGTASGIENSHLDPLVATRRAIVRAAAAMAPA